MTLFVWIDGKLVPESKAVIPVSDSAYLYGIGLFETMRAVGGKILFFPLHYLRLQSNAKRTGLKLTFSEKALENEILKTIQKNKLRDSTIRMMLSETPEGKPRLVILAKPFVPYPKRCYTEGARLMVARTMIADTKTLAPIKTTSYLTKMIARREAAKQMADEAILLDEKGFVTEGASSNIFMIKNKKLITPPLGARILPGTRRRIVLELAKKMKIPVLEKNLRLSDLYKADEIFITSSLKDIMPVGWVEGKKIGKTNLHTTTNIIRNKFLSLAHAGFNRFSKSQIRGNCR